MPSIIIALFVPIFFEGMHIIAYIINCIYTEKWINWVDKLYYEYYRVNLWITLWNTHYMPETCVVAQVDKKKQG